MPSLLFVKSLSYVLYTKNHFENNNLKTYMNSKSLLIAIAALALTASGAQAFSGETLRRAGLSESQRAAFAVARDLREEGDTEGARNILVEAGIDEKVIERVRSAIADDTVTKHSGRYAALQAGDYESFKVAVVGLPLADIITTEADFEQFKAAHTLRRNGNTKSADAIFTELGMLTQNGRAHIVKKHSWHEELTDEQAAAFTVAQAANDRDAMEAIIEEAGIVRGDRSSSPKYLRDGRILD